MRSVYEEHLCSLSLETLPNLSPWIRSLPTYFLSFLSTTYLTHTGKMRPSIHQHRRFTCQQHGPLLGLTLFRALEHACEMRPAGFSANTSFQPNGGGQTFCCRNSLFMFFCLRCYFAMVTIFFATILEALCQQLTSLPLSQDSIVAGDAQC